MKIANYFKCFKDKNIIFFVLLVVLYNGVVAVLNIFMNTFLLNSLGRTEVLLYNLILALVQPVAMLTSLFVCRKIGYLNTQRLGFAFYAIVFFYYLYLVKKSQIYIISSVYLLVLGLDISLQFILCRCSNMQMMGIGMLSKV